MTKTDFEKAAKEYANGWGTHSDYASFLAGCEHAYSIDKETIERLEKEKEELFQALKRLIEKAAPQTHSMDIEKACTVLNNLTTKK